MSIGKRLIDLARSNLTDFRSAFDRDHLRDLLSKKEEPEPEAEETEQDGKDGSRDSDESIGSRAGRRARKVRDAAEEAWEKAYETAKARAGVRGGSSDPVADRKRWYKTLEVEPGADLQQIRRAYRKMLAQYHPDRFAQDPEKHRVATEVTRKLTEAYNGLTQDLGG